MNIQDIFSTLSDLSTSSTGSPYHICEDGVVLYASALFKQKKSNICTLCLTCHEHLSKGNIPKFSLANNVWLGETPVELQGLTIPEEKLISLYRHNSCIIKLHSPFHSTTTAQAALRGNCITFLQNIPNIANSLPLTLNDFCDTLKVIFVGANPPKRLHLRKVLTVRKKKVAEALHWLKRNNVLYHSVEINLENIAELPDDDVPESIISTMEQRIGDEENRSERAGYVPDALFNPTDCSASDSIPMQNR